MTYNIIRISPTGLRTLVDVCSTKKEAQNALSDLRKKYAKDSPKGSKSSNRWYGKETIYVLDGGDELKYTITKG
jgi:hypothetical protein